MSRGACPHPISYTLNPNPNPAPQPRTRTHTSAPCVRARVGGRKHARVQVLSQDSGGRRPPPAACPTMTNHVLSHPCVVGTDAADIWLRYLTKPIRLRYRNNRWLGYLTMCVWLRYLTMSIRPCLSVCWLRVPALGGLPCLSPANCAAPELAPKECASAGTHTHTQGESDDLYVFLGGISDLIVVEHIANQARDRLDLLPCAFGQTTQPLGLRQRVQVVPTYRHAYIHACM